MASLAQILGEILLHGEFRPEHPPRYLVGHGTQRETVRVDRLVEAEETKKHTRRYGKLVSGSLADRILRIVEASEHPVNSHHIIANLRGTDARAYVFWQISILTTRGFLVRTGTKKGYFYSTKGALCVRGNREAAREASGENLGVRKDGLSVRGRGEETERAPTLPDVAHLGLEV